MKLGSILRSVGVLIIALGLSGCGDQWTWNQKITVKVETPDGEKSASSVIRHTMIRQDGWFVLPEARGAGSGYSGEAVVLEVSPGRYLFALLKDTPNPFKVFFPGEAPVEVAGRFKTLREERTVPPNLYPLLVTFTDIDDPSTVRRLDPNNFAAVFGPGFSITEITLEITDERVTEGRIENVLEWLSWPRDRFLAAGGGRTPLRVPNAAVGRTDFVRGEK